jgi:hypothetical protein
MADQGFGSDLWKNLQEIKLGEDGGVDAPVRANGRDGIVVGVDHAAAADTASAEPAGSSPRRRGGWAWLRRR